MSTNATLLREAVFTRASAVTPAGFSAWALARQVAAPTLNTTTLPALQVALAEERLSPDGDANAGEIRFIGEATISIVVLRGLSDPATLDGQADTDIDAILDALFQDPTFTSPAFTPPTGADPGQFYFEGVGRIENRRRINQDAEGYLLELSLEITFDYRLRFTPAAPNWLEEIDVSVEEGKSGPLPVAAIEVGDIVVSASGPSTGAHGAPSSPFTVSLEAGASFTGNQSVTIVDGGAGGLFTPSVGAPGIGSLVVQPASGATSFTFTYTAAAPGALTITFTDAQGWRDPAPLAFTAS